MFEVTLDSYAHSNALKNVNTYFKFLFGIITMIVNITANSPIVPLFIFAFLSCIIIFKAKISAKFYFKFASIPFAFALITFIFMSILFGVGSPILNLGVFHLAVTADGFNRGFLVFGRIMGGFACLAFLALTTPTNELFSVMKDIKIPDTLLDISMLMYRYIFVCLDEAITMHHSQETRLGYSTLKNSYKSAGMLMANLFIVTWIKGEKSYLAMESRGYDGTIKSLNDHGGIKDVKIRNLVLLTLFEAILFIGTFYTAGFKIF